MLQVSDNWKGGVTVNPTHLCQDLLGSKELRETRGRAGEVNIFGRSLSSNHLGWVWIKKVGPANILEKTSGGEKGAFIRSCFQSLPNLKEGKLQEGFALFLPSSGILTWNLFVGENKMKLLRFKPCGSGS